MTLIEARGVGKVFSEGGITVTALKNVSVGIEAGEIVGLEGPSGSGKTTLLSVLGCILTPTSGTVWIEGSMVGRKRLLDVRRRSIGFVFQQYHLIASLTALENVQYALRIKRSSRGAERAEAHRLLGLVGLADCAGFLPRDLSGGQKQRVAIARALAGNPSALLADEPTANLDSRNADQILDLFHDLARRRGCGILIVTHDPKVRRVVDRLEELRDGMLVTNVQPDLRKVR